MDGIKDNMNSLCMSDELIAIAVTSCKVHK